jgi:hypothetical protein
MIAIKREISIINLAPRMFFETNNKEILKAQESTTSTLYHSGEDEYFCIPILSILQAKGPKLQLIDIYFKTVNIQYAG